jgi:hypothetical protein
MISAYSLTPSKIQKTIWLRKEVGNYNLKINPNKTKIMRISNDKKGNGRTIDEVETLL